mgnify:CR=1 FL=1
MQETVILKQSGAERRNKQATISACEGDDRETQPFVLRELSLTFRIFSVLGNFAIGEFETRSSPFRTNFRRTDTRFFDDSPFPEFLRISYSGSCDERSRLLVLCSFLVLGMRNGVGIVIFLT